MTYNQGRIAALIKLARFALHRKQAVVDAATLSAGAGGAPPGMDPAAAAGGGMPPGGMPPGGDPMAAMGGGGAPPPPDPALESRLTAIESQMAAGGSAGAGVQPIKPKIDVNVELLQIKKLLARIADSMGISIPASDMAVTSQDLTQMAQQQGQGGGGAAGGAGSAIAPISPLQGASPELAKSAATLQQISDAAYALGRIMQAVGNAG